MKILHVGWGFQPYRGGGLIEYAEDLMEIQAKNGYEVSYFCTGRFSILSDKPQLRSWRNEKGYKVFELWNPPIIGGLDLGIKHPEADVAEPATASIFLHVVADINPDVVHFQEMLGIPTAVIEKLKSLDVKTVFTVEDYFYLCPTLKLVLPNGQACRIKDDRLGRQCADCCQNAPSLNLSYKLHMMYRNLLTSAPATFLKKIKKSISRRNRAAVMPGRPVVFDEQKIKDFNYRRAFNLHVLKSIDLVIAMSHKVADIFNYYQPLDNMITLNLTLAHIDKLQPKLFGDLGNRMINFAVINAMDTPLKGRNLILELFEMIDGWEWKDKLSFSVMGYINVEDEEFLKKYSFVTCTGKFSAKHLDTLFNQLDIHVGIMPSVWEEAYGYVGIEFLAKGIPVIGNKIGGIPDYVNEKTGWLNQTCDAVGLYNIINNILADPAAISAINKHLSDYRNKYIKPMALHFQEMDTLYRNLLNKSTDY